MNRDIATLHPTARKAAEADLRIIEEQMHGYQGRLDLWYARIWDLQGLWLDPDGRMIRHMGQEVALTKREFQLLEFLLSHPHRYFTTAHILGRPGRIQPCSQRRCAITSDGFAGSLSI